MGDVLVAGAGAVGLWLAARLHDAGVDTTVLTRPTVAQAIAKDGVRITGATVLGMRMRTLVDVEAPLAAGERFRAVIITAKAHQTAAIAVQAAPLVQDGGVFATLQNGFGNAAKLKAARPGPVAVSITSNGLTMESPGLVRHAGSGPTRVGPAAPEDEPSARQLQRLLARAGLNPHWMDDPRPFVWQKALINHAVNPVAALEGVPNGALLSEPLRSRCALLLDEGYALSRAAGVALPGGEAGLKDALWGTLRKTPTNRVSMLQDLARGRPTEVEQITGRLVRLARRLGYPMFASEETYRAVKEREAKLIGDEESLRLTRDELAWETASL